MTRTTSVRLIALAVMLAAAPSALAFRMIQNTSTGRVSAGYAVPCDSPGGFTHWTTISIPWHHNTSGQGAGKAAALQAAMASWSGVPNSSQTLTYAGTTTAGFATDGRNTILFTKGNGCTGMCLAITALVLAPGQVITETDISFNSRYSWRTDGGTYDTESVAAHELGHSLGIHHTEITGSPRPTMYASYFGPDGRSLENDDKSALQCSQGRYPPQ